MIIDFDKVPEEAKKNFYGGNNEFNLKAVDDGKNKILFGRLEKGSSIGLHTHEDSSEIMYFTGGKGKFLYDGKEEAVSAGQCHYCPRGHSHTLSIENDEPLLFFAVVART